MSRVEPKERPADRQSQRRSQQQVDDRHPSKAEGDERDVEQALDRQEEKS